MTEAYDRAAATGTVVIAGAGPAGLTAALELLKQPGWHPIVFESDYAGRRNLEDGELPRQPHGPRRPPVLLEVRLGDELVAGNPAGVGHARGDAGVQLSYQGQPGFSAPESGRHDDGRVMLVRPRLSRIYYRRNFFDYPLKLNASDIGNLGWLEAGALGVSYARSRVMPRHPELTLEDFFINRFGDRLYRTFFKDYTEKVWGVPCQRDLGRMGRPTGQGTFDHQRDHPTLSSQPSAARAALRRKTSRPA